MFIKKELSEEELRDRRSSLDASLKNAVDAKKKILNEKIDKLRSHSQKVSEIRSKSTSSSNHLNKSENFVTDFSEFLSTMNKFENLEKFQSFMQKPESLFKASKLVAFIENHCNKKSCDSVKSRPKVMMSLALLARFPNEVIPNPDSDEQKILEKAKSFYDDMISFFVNDQTTSKKDHEELAWSWIGTIHAFDEWLIKDKQVLFAKMKNDFLTWTKTIGIQPINHKSRSEWEPHAVKYQNEILKRIQETFGEDYLNILLKEVKDLNEEFSEMELIIKTNIECKDYYCKWEKKLSIPEKAPESDQLDSNIFEKLKTTNIRILHEMMIKETDLKFENILNFSGKSLNEISRSNKENLRNLVSILETESDSKSISNTLQELFLFVSSSLYELAGDNDDYCQEIRLIDCNIDPDDWLHDSYRIIRWTLSMCRKCCAPARDSNCEEIEVCLNEIKNPESHSKISESLTNVITLLLDLLNLMRSDFCNFRLKFLMSQIEGKGIVEKYELDELKKTFTKYGNTIKWLSKRNSDYLKKPIEILIDSFINFFDAEGDYDLESDLPETFYLDIDRIKRYRNEFENQLKKEAGLIYLKNHLKSSKIDEVEKENILLKPSESADIENEADLIELFKQSISELSGEDVSLLQGNINRLFKKGSDDKVFLLLKNRELSAIRTILMSEQNVSNDTLRGKICSLFKYNKSCFSSIYDEIILKK